VKSIRSISSSRSGIGVVVTVEHVHPDGGDLGVGGRAGVAAGVGGRRVLHQQVRGGGRALLRHHRHAAARRVVRYYLLHNTTRTLHIRVSTDMSLI
jgi:hypothetical protein